MMPKDLQHKVLDECAVNWDETTESKIGRLFTKMKAHVAEHRQGKARDGRSENDGSGSRLQTGERGPAFGTASTATRARLRRSTTMRRAATRRTYSTVHRKGAVARWAAMVSEDIDTSVVDSGTRSGIAYKGKGKRERFQQGRWGMEKVMARMDTQARRTAKERKAIARTACGRLALGVGLRSTSSRIARRTRTSSEWRRTTQRFSSLATFRTKKHSREWKKVPMKVTLGDFVKGIPRVPILQTHLGQTGVAKNRFKVLEVDDVEEVENVRPAEK